MKRLWGIRHLRWWWAAWALAYRMACGFKYANEQDLAYLDAIWEGKV
jgi:hypothetical protein